MRVVENMPSRQRAISGHQKPSEIRKHKQLRHEGHAVLKEGVS